MERKKIENMVKYCKSEFYCGKCPYSNICEISIDLLEVSERISSLPNAWNDEDIDYILDEIN